jgi:DNA modification methylase
MRPSGHDISKNFIKDQGGAIPPNLLQLANTESNSYYLRACRNSGLKPHPARFPIGLPSFFIKLLTKPGDTVLDPFAGSNVTGEAAEDLGRRWIGMELNPEYVVGSRFRFDKPEGDTKQNGEGVRQVRRPSPKTTDTPLFLVKQMIEAEMKAIEDSQKGNVPLQ